MSVWLSTAKKFLVGQSKAQPTEKRGRKTQNIGGFIGILLNIIGRILDAAALSIRVFLRKNLGERTFNGWTLLLAFLWVWYFVYEGIQLETLRPDYAFFHPIAEALNHHVFGQGNVNATDRSVFFKSLDKIFWYLFALNYYIYQMLQYFDTFLHSLFNGSNFQKVSFLSYYYSIILAFLGILNFILNWKNSTITYQKMDSYYRGDSVFFTWLSLIKIRIRGSEISLNKEFIWLFAEPLIVLVIASFLYFSGYDQNFSIFLLISAIALFLEELRELKINRSELLDIFDGEYKAKRIETKLASFDKSTVNRKIAQHGAVLSKRN